MASEKLKRQRTQRCQVLTLSLEAEVAGTSEIAQLLADLTAATLVVARTQGQLLETLNEQQHIPQSKIRPAEPQSGIDGLEFITEAQLAEYLDLSIKTLRNWRSKGEGPPHRPVARGVVIYEIAAVDAWIRRVKPRFTSAKR